MSKKSKGKHTIGAIGEWLVYLAMWLVGVWLAMILIGIAHSTDARVPALGFGTLAVILAALATVGIADGIRPKRTKS